MAEFNNLRLTYRGAKALLEAQAGNTLFLSKIGLGSGISEEPASEMVDMVKREIFMPIVNKIVADDGKHITLVAKMTNENIAQGFCWRETGLYFQDIDGNDILFAYSSVEGADKYDYVPAYSDQRYVKHVRIANMVSDQSTINITGEPGLLYVDVLTYEEFLEEYEKHLNRFEEHLKDYDNPHRVTAKNVGLEKVPNVGTNDQTPVYKVSKDLEELSSGEKLSVAFGKIARAIKSLIEHLGERNGTVTVTGTNSECKITAREFAKIRLNSKDFEISSSDGSNSRSWKLTSNNEHAFADQDIIRKLADYGNGLVCHWTGVVMVSGSVYFKPQKDDSVKRCFVLRYSTATGREELTEVCFQSIEGSGGGGLSAGTKIINVQDGDVLYLCAYCSEDAVVDEKNNSTYLSVTYLRS